MVHATIRRGESSVTKPSLIVSDARNLDVFAMGTLPSHHKPEASLNCNLDLRL